MNIYMAPMEGITVHIYRQAHLHHFGQIDRYYMPFLSSLGLNYKEIRDIAPENNQGMDVIPQILTNHADIFLGLAQMFKELGYREVNLNLGCPSGTVTAKGRGSGFLRYLPELDHFFEEIFAGSPLPISVKTRIGYASEEEWPAILELLAKYPFTEMIIHPRLRADLYRGEVRPNTYELAVKRMIRPGSDEHSSDNKHQISLCYNGDINTVDDYERMLRRFPNTESVMLGRGLIANPGLAGELKGDGPMKREQLAGFLDEILSEYRKVVPEDKNILFRLLEIWTYLSRSFPDGERILKKIRRSKSLREYESAVNEALRTFGE